MYDDRPLLKKVITIASAEKKTSRTGGEYFVIIDSNKNKFKVWKSKKDGSVTKAWEGLQALGLDMMGAQVSVGYSEEEKEFTGDDQKQVKYTDRTVKFFESVDSVSTATPPQNPVTKDDFLTGQSEQTPDEEVTVEDIPF